VARRHFAFWKASCAEAIHFNVLAPPSGDQSKGVTPVHNWAENSGKIHHAKKMLQLFSKEGTAKTYFS
jgi:hypothetical protein